MDAQQLLSEATSLLAKFQLGSDTVYIDEAIALDREALNLCQPNHAIRSAALTQLASHLWHRYKQLGGIENLNEAIDLDRDALALRPPGDADRSTSLSNLALHLTTRCKQLEETSDTDEAIVLERDALALRPPGHPDRSTSLSGLALHLAVRSMLLEETDDLKEAIVLERDALALRPPGHPDRSTSLSNLAMFLSTQYELLGGVDGLNEAVVLERDALALRSQGHPDRSTSLSNLATHLATRYNQLGGVDDLNEAIDLSVDALALCQEGKLDRPKCLVNLAYLLGVRYNLFGRIDDVNEAIRLSRDALAHCPLGNLGRSTSLGNIATHLFTRYKQLGEIDDLQEAIVLSRDALALYPTESSDKSMALNNLALCLSTRYNKLGGVDDLNEAITLNRDALVLCPTGYSGRSTCLNNLANHLSTRYRQLGGLDDLNEAIQLSLDALVLCPLGHPDRAICLNSVAQQLSIRSKRLGGIDDLNEAIHLARDALALHAPGHPGLSVSLYNLASYLFTRYNQLRRIEDLNEAIGLSQDSLLLFPPGHPGRSRSLNDLASFLSSRYNELGGLGDLDKAIDLARDALELCPLGNPDRSTSLSNLAEYLVIRFTKLGEVGVREQIFDLYAQLGHISHMVSSFDISAAKAWISAAEALRHHTTLPAYETALRLLAEHLATLPSLPQHLSVIKELSSSLAADAFSACLRNHSLPKAVELLEQGRGVFWNQLSRLRSPLDEVVTSGTAGEALANEFTHLTSRIRSVFDSPGADQHDRVCALNVELQRVVSNIRELPGHSRFLLPQTYSNLQHAASGGPVIIVNASKHSCDALVVFVDREPAYIPLSVTKEDVRKMSLTLRTLTKLAKSMDVSRDLYILLRELWDRVVSHIAGFLQTACPLQSRIWWCPTAEFSLLPLHAANPFRKGQKGISDLYISSYTPTLTALIRARRPSPLASVTQEKHFITIGQGNALGACELPSVATELANIGQLMGSLAKFSHIEGPESCIARVTDELSKNDWVHFACHGIPNRKEPFASAFALHDGRFTIQHINRSNLQNAEFAYLSACYTTAGDEESPDEMIHLASAMQFAGFRSVIGTMWAVADDETDKITSVFYQHMKDESGHLDHTRAAFALRKTMKSVKITPDQRILYVHLGA